MKLATAVLAVAGINGALRLVVWRLQFRRFVGCTVKPPEKGGSL